jgi:hypothetical protein
MEHRIDLTVLYISRGEVCGDIDHLGNFVWFKKWFTKQKGGKLIESSSELIAAELAENKVKTKVAQVGQVVTNYDEGNNDTAHKFFPHIKPTQIVFRNRDQFLDKIYGLAIAGTVAVVVSTDELETCVGIVDTSHLAIHEVHYRFEAEETLTMLPEQTMIITYGVAGKYETEADRKSCVRDFHGLTAFEVDSGYCCWMKDLHGNTPLKAIVVAQIHDAMTGYMDIHDRHTWHLDIWGLNNIANLSSNIGKWVVTQSMTPVEAFLAGARSFDLRVFVTPDGEAVGFHGPVIIHHSVLDLLTAFSGLLDNHPSECIFLLVKLSGDKNHFGSVVADMLDTLNRDRVHVGNGEKDGALLLSDVRGKFVLFSEVDLISQGAPDIVSYYKTFHEAGCQGSRTRAVLNFKEFETYYAPCFPLVEDAGKLTVLQVHAQVNKGSIKKAHGSGGIKALARQFNAKSIQWLQHLPVESVKKLNLLEFDYFSGALMPALLTLNAHNMTTFAKQ